jgi:hypothetical protein
MKILFLGDSYSVNYEGWPSRVVNILNAKAVNHSRAASSLNYMFTKLDHALKYEFYDIVIATITSGDRVFHSDKIIHAGFPQSELIQDVINDSSTFSIVFDGKVLLELDHVGVRFFIPVRGKNTASWRSFLEGGPDENGRGRGPRSLFAES